MPEPVFVYGALFARNAAKVTVHGANGPVSVVFAPWGVYVNGERVAPIGDLSVVSVDDAREIDRDLTPAEIQALLG